MGPYHDEKNLIKLNLQPVRHRQPRSLHLKSLPQCNARTWSGCQAIGWLAVGLKVQLYSVKSDWGTAFACSGWTAHIVMRARSKVTSSRLVTNYCFLRLSKRKCCLKKQRRRGENSKDCKVSALLMSNNMVTQRFLSSSLPNNFWPRKYLQFYTFIDPTHHS